MTQAIAFSPPVALSAFVAALEAVQVCALGKPLFGRVGFGCRSLVNPSHKSLVRSVAGTLNHEGLSTCRKIITENTIRFPKTERTRN